MIADFGKQSRQEEQADSDVDLLIIGKLRLSEAISQLKQAETRLGRPINPSLYTKSDFSKKLKSGQHFATTLVQGETLFILGDAGEFAEAFAKPKNTAAPNKSKRTR